MGERGDILTKDSLKVLELLKKAQGTEDNTVYLNADELFARTVIEAGQPYVSVDLSEYSDRLNSILLSLSDEGYIRKLFVDFEYLQVTHEGWHRYDRLKRLSQKRTQQEAQQDDYKAEAVKQKRQDRKHDYLVALFSSVITFLLTLFLQNLNEVVAFFENLFK